MTRKYVKKWEIESITDREIVLRWRRDARKRLAVTSKPSSVLVCNVDTGSLMSVYFEATGSYTVYKVEDMERVENG
jgi:hypothetical protein